MTKHTLMAVVVAALLGASAASQANWTCTLGYTCLWDTDPAVDKKSGVKGNNDNFRNFGFDNVTNRLRNNGRYQNNCLYTGYNQSRKDGDYWMLLERGDKATLHFAGDLVNNLSSNKWTSENDWLRCPNR